MYGDLSIYNTATQKLETYHINGGQVRRGKSQKIVIAGSVPMSQQHEICKAITQLEKALLNAQGWDGRMIKVEDRD